MSVKKLGSLMNEKVGIGIPKMKVKKLPELVCQL